MKYLLKNAYVFKAGRFSRKDLLTENGMITMIAPDVKESGAVVLDFSDKYLFPGFVDVHVHFREPGFSYKETIKTGTLAAAHGGFTSVMTMPNLHPVPDCIEHLHKQIELIRSNAVVKVYPYGAITVSQKGEKLADLEKMSELVKAFSDDGKGVQSEKIMHAAMIKAGKLGMIIAAHCEDNSLLCGGYIHDGEYAAAHRHKGICSESEWKPIARDLKLAAETGCAYHICHVSAKESVELIRKAKSEGVNVTCETAPHYLVLNDGMLKDEGCFKMNPPVRSEADRLALIEGIQDGTVDMIATDHAPHSAEEKSGGLKNSLMGIVGLETAFPVLYTKLVKTGVISLEKLLCLMSKNPGKRFGLETGLAVGKSADLTVFDLSQEYTIDPKDFFSKGKSTPFSGERVYGKFLLTMAGGKIAFKEAAL